MRAKRSINTKKHYYPKTMNPVKNNEQPPATPVRAVERRRPTPRTDAKESECNRIPLLMGYLRMRNHAAATERELAAALEKVAYVERMGLRFGMMKSSDKPEPYLAHVWDEDSDHERVFREWSASIGLGARLRKVTEQRDALANVGKLLMDAGGNFCDLISAQNAMCALMKDVDKPAAVDVTYPLECQVERMGERIEQLERELVEERENFRQAEESRSTNSTLLNRAICERDTLAAALKLFPGGLHRACERGPCICSHCEAVRAREKALTAVEEGTASDAACAATPEEATEDDTIPGGSWEEQCMAARELKDIFKAEAANLRRDLAAAREQADRLGKVVDRNYADASHRDNAWNKLRDQRDTLVAALRGILKVTPRSLSCDDFHHPKEDRHKDDEECNPTSRFRAAWAIADKALAAVEGGQS